MRGRLKALETGILIAGAEPVGMTLALLLAKWGVASIVAERHSGLHPMPQAHVQSFASLGLI